jgi:uncharacterized phage protein (TIGR01671 family)
MHNIKFRAWDNLEKRMRKVVSLHWQGDKLVSAKLEGESEPIPIDGRLEIEQYTGLKDKNGKEICGGDVIAINHPEWIEPTLHRVKYFSDEGYPAFDIVPTLGDESNGLSAAIESDNLTVRVVDNIHKNPELLEEK